MELPAFDSVKGMEAKTMAVRKTIRLSQEEDSTLRHLYRSQRVPVDQYRRRQVELARLADAFNAATGQQFPPGVLLHYMIRRRKDGKWETFDGDHVRARPLPQDVLSEQEWILVDRLYVEFGVGADTFLYDTLVAERFSTAVAGALGRAIRPDLLAAALVERRKNDDLPRLRPQDGFRDIDEVA